MKNHLGLIVAIVLGVIGATLNFLYLTSKAANFEKVAFLSVDARTSIKRGEAFREDHFSPLEIPKIAVSSQLSHDAILFSDRGTVVGMKATRDYAGGEMVLQDQLKTPPPELALTGENERAMWVPVDTRTFVPSLIRPGDMVSFLVPKGVIPVARAPQEGEEQPPPPPTAGDSELVGPFKVLSVGNRLGSAEVFKAAGMPQQQENVLTISVHAQGNQLDPMAKKLWDLLQAGGFRQAGVILHPRGIEPR
jgi:Flp pilus assembly protein CpaB